MEQKFGQEFFNDMIDRGRRELGAVFFEGSVAQPMYPLRGSYGPPKQLEGPEPSRDEPGRDDMAVTEVSQNDPGKDDRDQGPERE